MRRAVGIVAVLVVALILLASGGALIHAGAQLRQLGYGLILLGCCVVAFRLGVAHGRGQL